MTQKYNLNDVSKSIITAAVHDLWQNDHLIAKALNKSAILAENYRADIAPGFFDDNQLTDAIILKETIAKLKQLIENPNATISLGLQKINLVDDNGNLVLQKMQQLLNLLELKQNHQSLSIPTVYLEKLATEYDDFTILSNNYGLEAINNSKEDSRNTPYSLCNQLLPGITPSLQTINNLIVGLNGVYNYLADDNNTIATDADSSAIMLELKNQALLSTTAALNEQATEISRTTTNLHLKQLAKATSAMANLIYSFIDNTQLYQEVYGKDNRQHKFKNHSEELINKVLHNSLSPTHSARQQLINNYFTTRTGSFAEQQAENNRLISLCNKYLNLITEIKTYLNNPLTLTTNHTPAALAPLTAQLENLKTSVKNNEALLNNALLANTQLLHDSLSTTAWQTYLPIKPQSDLKLETAITALAKAATPSEINQFINIAVGAKNLNKFVLSIQQEQQQPEKNNLFQHFLNAPHNLANTTAELININKKIKFLDKRIAKTTHKLAKLASAPHLESALARLNTNKQNLLEQKANLINNPLSANTNNSSQSKPTLLQRLLKALKIFSSKKNPQAKFKKIILNADVNKQVPNSHTQILVALPVIANPAVLQRAPRQVEDNNNIRFNENPFVKRHRTTSKAENQLVDRENQPHDEQNDSFYVNTIGLAAHR